MARRRPPRIPGVKKARLWAGDTDLSMVIDHDAVRRNRLNARIQAEHARTRTALEAEQSDALEYARLQSEWENAPKGAEKRTALAALRAYERRTGRYVPPVSTVAVAESSSLSWQEAK